MGNRASGETADWVDVSYASERTGFSAVAILRLVADGDMPAMQVRSRRRTSHRLPRRLVDEAYAAVMAGGQVELREFARQWADRNASDVAVA